MYRVHVLLASPSSKTSPPNAKKAKKAHTRVVAKPVTMIESESSADEEVEVEYVLLRLFMRT